MNSELIPIGLGWICPQDHSGKVSCQNFTIDVLVGQAQAGRPGIYPFWLKFGYVVPAIKYTPMFVEIIRFNNFAMIMSCLS